ncbi:toll/interleukin-1 receptor domain-containing protein [Vibrio cholerae]|uniref:toll/interleukin-1 receptor domain-containing protein n=1 Tax=Vibrio cholerae TaxID=666 RepID=UPI0007444E92|nr:toll/interleukin-1 receptor domain-containing protein [Vibrio cholerae]KUO23237.1 hypothetical protein AVO51_18235 [Vibrio cholerae]
MAKVFISINANAGEIEENLYSRLSEQHELLHLQPEIGNEWKASFRSVAQEVDAFILLITDSNLNSKWHKHELDTIVSYALNADKALIPIVIGQTYPPKEIAHINCIFFDPRDIGEIDQVVNLVNQAISAQLGRNLAKESKRAKQIQQLESKAASYVAEAITGLKQRESTLKKSAVFWYWLGYLAIASGVIASLIFAIKGFGNFGAGKTSWDFVVFVAIKSIVLIGLLLSLSKYAFTLGKSFMDEALKNADRIHAISFGQFYLKAYGENSDPNNIKDVFQHWNTGGRNAFSTLSAESFDPKLIEAIATIVHASGSSGK